MVLTKESLRDRIANEIETGKMKNIHSLIFIQDREIIINQTFQQEFVDNKHYLASITKSITSLVFGTAITNNIFEGKSTDEIINSPLFIYLPNYAYIFEEEPKKKEILLKHVLSMSTGLEWDDWDDCHNLEQSDDAIKYYLQKPLIHEPGSIFTYSGGCSALLSYILQNKTQKSVVQLAKTYLFEPLNISRYHWRNYKCELTDTSGGLSLFPLDLCKIGELCLNEGEWEGIRLISKEWMQLSTKEHIINIGTPNYGYHWWNGSFYYDYDKYSYTYVAAGHGGQRLIIIPEFKGVVVITQKVFDNDYEYLNVISLLTRFIFPFMDQSSSYVKPISFPSTTLNHSQYTGVYKWDTNVVKVFSQNNQMIIQGSDKSEVKLEPMSAQVFRANIMGLGYFYLIFSDFRNKKYQSFKLHFDYRDEFYSRITNHKT